MTTDNNNNNNNNSPKEKTEPPRLAFWAVLTCISIIMIADGANLSAFEKERTQAQKWTLAVPCITLALGVLAIVAHGVLGDRFVSTPLEGGLITLCFGFWAAGMPSAMNPRNGIAVYGDYGYTDEEGLTVTLSVGDNGIVIINGIWANAYFLSWGSFIVSLIMLGSFIKEVVESFRPQYQFKRFLWWMALCTTSFVVMASAGRTFHLSNCVHAESPESKYIIDPTIACRRVKFAVALGVLSALWTFVMGMVTFVLTHFVKSMSKLLPLILESFAAVLMLILWTFGMLFITISSKAPAREPSNLYFGTCASFIIAIFLATGALVETYHAFLNRHDVTTVVKGTPVAEAAPGMEIVIEENA